MAQPQVFGLFLLALGVLSFGAQAEELANHSKESSPSHVVTLLQKGRRVGEAFASVDGAQCHTVTEGSPGPEVICYEFVGLALKWRVFDHLHYDNWQKIQAYYNQKGEYHCPAPCPPCNVTVYANSYSKQLFSLKVGECVADGAGGSIIMSGTYRPEQDQGWSCAMSYYAKLRHYDTPTCSGEYKEWTQFTDGDVSQMCRNMTGHIVEGGCRGVESVLRP